MILTIASLFSGKRTINIDVGTMMEKQEDLISKIVIIFAFLG